MWFFCLLTSFLFSFGASAEEAVKSKWSHESEVSIVTIDGNSESETLSGKQTTKYSRKKDSATVKAAIKETEASGTTTAKSSNMGLRYDRTIDRRLGGFVGHAVYSDKFAGFVQEDRSDLGASYTISKRDDQSWTAELGYQHTEIHRVGGVTASLDSLRVATAYSKNINENVTAGASVEYRDAFEDAENTDTPQYWVDSEVNLAVVMSKILSLKLAYESKYQNFVPPTATERVDTTFTTALVSKF